MLDPHHGTGFDDMAGNHHSHGDKAAANHSGLLETFPGRAVLSTHFMGHVSRSFLGHHPLHLRLQQGHRRH
jgi:hypothetical protein